MIHIITPGEVYELQAKDLLSVPSARRFTRRVGYTSASATPGGEIYEHVNADTVLCVTNWVLDVLGGAAQSFHSAMIRHIDASSGGIISELAGASEVSSPAAVARRFSGMCSFCLFVGEKISVTSTFSAATNNNTVFTSLQGWFIPRGSLQR